MKNVVKTMRNFLANAVIDIFKSFIPEMKLPAFHCRLQIGMSSME
jgi:hypothetical protein